jgi:hypothetical protein
LRSTNLQLARLVEIEFFQVVTQTPAARAQARAICSLLGWKVGVCAPVLPPSIIKADLPVSQQAEGKIDFSPPRAELAIHNHLSLRDDIRLYEYLAQ